MESNRDKELSNGQSDVAKTIRTLSRMKSLVLFKSASSEETDRRWEERT